ncbi:type II toxin-antitoxin system RelE/ParE family toxin [Kineosporia sp. J2-2]|uniref:Type II toxin-antitoxin system RelE/ParE family toxin n=1 Tax=Kineosporia corallincola TaxID=2835133 RepID=A0ABS5TQY5_9ACTN|nr:type II toxin-antitoxin system RelE/ParE family toxin [Kineosporia corallincola]MBT0773174.1 type II toxin-antitoxin system RelE/ParE family toxin [Kineosporia corallincola]
MTYKLIVEAQATAQASAFLADDPKGLAEALRAIDELVDDPRPTDSFTFGSDNRRRIRVGRYRVLYEIRGDVINVVRIARVP